MVTIGLKRARFAPLAAAIASLIGAAFPGGANASADDIAAKTSAAPDGAAPESTPQLQREQSVIRQKTVAEALAPEDIAGIFRTLEIPATVTYNQGQPVILVSDPESGGLGFVVFARGCENGGCQILQPFANLSAPGLTLAQANTINRDKLARSHVMFLNDGTAFIATKIFLNQGAAPGNIVYQLALFVRDLDTVLSSVSPGVLASIKPGAKDFETITFQSGAGIAVTGKIDNSAPAPIPVGVNAPKFVTPEVMKVLEN